jgi:hypothetical protein
MPSNQRVRDNNIFGVVADSPLSIGATALNSTGLANMSAIVVKHATITLDPLRQYGNPEIIIVTAHTAASSVATITRGAYGTVAREHPQGTLWVHAPLNEDFIQMVTTLTRPTNPYEGQFIFEIDSNKLVGYGGVDWAPRDAGGQLGFIENRTVTDQVITAGVLLAGLTTTVTVGTGRRIKATCKTNVFSDIIETSAYYEIRLDGVAMDRAYVNRLSGASEQTICWSSVSTPSAGSHTYTVFGIRNGGTGIVTNRSQAAQSTFLLVEDIGAA